MQGFDREVPAKKNRNSAKSGFVGNVLTLAGGNAVAQIVTVAFVPVITRIFPPGAFGLFATLMAVSTIFIAISSFRYSAAILLPPDQKDSNSVVALGLMLVCVLVGILFVVCMVFQDEINKSLSFELYPNLLFIIPVMVFLGGSYNIINTMALRGKDFPALAFSRISAAAADRTVSIAAGMSGIVGPFGLATGKITGQVTMLCVLLARSRNLQLFSCLTDVTWLGIRQVAHRYRRFPMFSWMALVQQLTINLPVLMLGLFFPASIVGFFALSRRTLLEPVHMVGDAIAKTFFEKAARDFRAGRDLSVHTLRLLRALLKYAVIPMVLFSLSAVDLFGYVFGESWRIAGEYAQVLAPLFVSILLIRPMSILFDLYDRQHEQGIYNLTVLCVSGSVFFAGGLFGEAYYTVLIYSLVNMLMVVTRITMLANLTGVKRSATLKVLFQSLLYAGLFVLPVILVKYAFNAPGWVTLISSMVWLAVYVIYLLFTDDVMSRFTRR